MQVDYRGGDCQEARVIILGMDERSLIKQVGGLGLKVIVFQAPRIRK